MIIQNDTNDKIHFDNFISNNKHVIRVNKKIISSKDNFEISITLLEKSNLRGIIVFKEFVIILLNYLQIHTGSGCFEIPLNDEKYKSDLINLTRNLPSPDNLMYSACYLKVLDK